MVLARLIDHHPAGGRPLALRREAEAMILYDPVFPADPFAH